MDLQERGIAILDRFWDENDVDLLDESIGLLTEALQADLPLDNHIQVLVNLGNAHLARFRELGSDSEDIRGDLEVSLKYLRDGRNIIPPDHTKLEAILDNLADGLLTRYEQTQDKADLDEAISLYRAEVESVKQQPDAAMDDGYPALLGRLADALSTRFKLAHDPPDLDESIVFFEQAVALSPSHSSQRSDLLNGLATALATRFDIEGKSIDLDNAISLYQEDLNFEYEDTAEDDEGRAITLVNLAALLCTRFELSGGEALDDLEAAIQFGRKALATETEQSRCLNNLGNALFNRYNRLGNKADLDQSFKYHTEALALRPPGHADRCLSLNNLANVYLAKFENQGVLSHLEKSIKYSREGLDLGPQPDHYRASSLTAVATGLWQRFAHAGNTTDLDECIALYREALGLQPLDTTQARRALTLDNLCGTLLARYDHAGDISDLEEAISYGIMSLLIRPSSDRDRPSSLNNVANAYMARFERRGNEEDLKECMKHAREGVGAIASSHPDHLGILNTVSNALLTQWHLKGELEDLEESIKFGFQMLDLTSKERNKPHRYMPLLHLGHTLRIRFSKLRNSDDIDQAIRLLRDGLDILAEPHPLRASCYHRLGQALWEKLSGRDKEQCDPSELEEALYFFELAARYETGSILDRLLSAQHWALMARTSDHFDIAMKAYRTAIDLLPLLSPVNKDFSTRRRLLANLRGLGPDAVNCAIESGELEQAVVFSASVQSFFWSQALQLRTPLEQLGKKDPQLASRLRDVSHQMEVAAQGFNTGVKSSMSSISPKQFYDLHLVKERDSLVREARKLPGFEEFLQPPSFKTIQGAASRGPIIFLHTHPRRSDALILTHDAVTNVKLDVTAEELAKLVGSVYTHVENGRGDDSPPAAPAEESDNDEAADHSGFRKLKPSVTKRSHKELENDAFRRVLGFLWNKVVHPIVEELRLERTASPPRIWWYPSGPFVFLPIHAAGIYRKDRPFSSTVCLSDYATSSYCSNLQDLSHRIQLPTDDDMSVLAVIQPEIPHHPQLSLPMANQELEKMKIHIPAEHLTVHLGMRSSPTSVDKVLSDLPNASVVHFGCHGYHHPIDPLESYLHLSGGKLTMQDLLRAEIRKPGLAYLSACQTAMGDMNQEDQYMHLVATMMFVGFKSVVGTMWAIADEDAPTVTDIFYGEVFKEGKPYPDLSRSAEALQRAIRELMKQGKDFKRWVSFVHFGI